MQTSTLVRAVKIKVVSLADQFDLLRFGCWRIAAVVLLPALATVAACAPEDSVISAKVQEASDAMNQVPDAPAETRWRLTRRADVSDQPYPTLAEVPPAPTNLPTPAETAAKIEALRAANAATGNPDLGSARPSAAALGAPPRPQIKPLTLPGYGQVGRAPAALLPQPGSPPPAGDLTLDLPLSPEGFAETREFAARFADFGGRIVLIAEGPQFSVDRVLPVYDQLLAGGLAPNRLSVTYREASAARIRIQALGR